MLLQAKAARDPTSPHVAVADLRSTRQLSDCTFPLRGSLMSSPAPNLGS